MLRRPSYIIFSAAFLFALVLLNLAPRSSARIDALLGTLFLPLFGIAGSAHAAADRASLALLPRRVLIEELDAERRKNDSLQLVALQLNRAIEENSTLRAQLKLQPHSTSPSKLAHVVGRDTANWWRSVEIDLGSRDGIQTNLPVVTGQGLVGRIDHVGYTRSRVVLIGDVRCPVSALVQETRDVGFTQPAPDSLDHSIVNLTFLAKTDQVRPGHTVLSSGQGTFFPKGITIGRIIETKSVDNGFLTVASVKLTVDLARLEAVWVLLP